MSQTIDLNYRLMCKYCRKAPPNIVEDHKAGDLVCGDCGLVFPMRIIDTSSEWRNFGASESGGAADDPSRVGAAENPLLEGVTDQLSTSISRKDGLTGTATVLSKAHHKVSGGVKGDRDLMQSFREITVMTERIGLPRTVGDRAKQLYKKIFDDDFAKNKPNEGIVAACILIACRQERVPRTFKEISVLTRVDKTILAKCVKSILPLVEEEIETVSNKDFVARFCSQMGLGIAIQNGAIEVVNRVDQLGFLAGKSPLTICAAAIYLISQLSDTPKTFRDIAPVAGVVEGTIRGAYVQMYARRKEIVPSNMPRIKGIEHLPAVERPVSVSGTTPGSSATVTAAPSSSLTASASKK